MVTKYRLAIPRGFNRTEPIDPRTTFFTKALFLLDSRFPLSETPSFLQRGTSGQRITLVYTDIPDIEKGSGPTRQMRSAAYQVGTGVTVVSTNLAVALKQVAQNLSCVNGVLSFSSEPRSLNGTMLNVGNMQFHSDELRQDAWGHVVLANLETSGLPFFRATSGTLSFIIIAAAKSGNTFLANRTENLSTKAVLESNSKPATEFKDWIANTISHLDTVARQTIQGLGEFRQEFFLLVKNI